MRKLVLVVAVLAILGLTAAKCSPAQREAVVQYANNQTADSVDIPDARPEPGPAVAAGPGWRVETTCDSAHVVLTGWTDVTDTLVDESDPTRRVPFAIFGRGSEPPGPIRLDANGDADVTYVVKAAYAGPAWEWSLLINGPGLRAFGTAAC